MTNPSKATSQLTCEQLWNSLGTGINCLEVIVDLGNGRRTYLLSKAESDSYCMLILRGWRNPCDRTVLEFLFKALQFPFEAAFSLGESSLKDLDEAHGAFPAFPKTDLIWSQIPRRLIFLNSP